MSSISLLNFLMLRVAIVFSKCNILRKKAIRPKIDEILKDALKTENVTIKTPKIKMELLKLLDDTRIILSSLIDYPIIKKALLRNNKCLPSSAFHSVHNK